MKLRKVSKSTITLSILASFPFLALATLVGIKINEKRVLKVGDVLEDGSQVVKVGVDKEKLVKYKPLVTPTDTYYSTQKGYSLSNVGDIESTWDYYTGEGTMIAVIDSGFTYGHEDFTKNGVSTFSNKSAYFHLDDYDNPTSVLMDLATSDGWECMKHEYDTDYDEWDTHGSNVVGCAAAAMNGVGTVGIAPDATILALKIDFYDESINEAIKYAADQGADVINMSLGAYDTDDPHTSSDSWDDCAEGNADAIAYAINKGCIVVAAAGNEKTSAKSYPACNEGVIGVGALAKNSSTNAASFSNFNKNSDTQSGNHNVDVMAPGVVWAPGLDASELYNDSDDYPSLGYGETQGTSFASPITAGAAALWKQKYPSGTPAQFEADLYSRSVDMGNFAKYGNGRLDVYRLLDIANEGFELSTTSLSLNTHSEDVEISATSKAGTIASWASNNANVVTVSGTTGSVSGTARVHVVGSGTAKITVTDNHGNTGTINVTVAQYVDVTGVTLSKNSAEVALNKTITLTANVQPSNATNQNITWSSENESIATVNNNGVVTPVALGTTNIVATTVENGFFAKCAMTVKEASAEPQSGEILFGTASGRTSINATSVTGDDSLGNEWTITTSGTSSFTVNASYSQIGSKNNPASSINFVTTLSGSVTVTDFSVDLGGFSGTEGTVTLSVDDVTVGTGSLSGTDDVTIEMDEDYAAGQELKVSITDIAKGVKAYGISYTYEEGGTPVTKTSMQKAYEAVSALASGSTTSKSYIFTGIITGKVGNSFYMQDGEYGMYVYGGGTALITDSQVGHEATVTAKLTNYNGMYETANNTATVDVSSKTGSVEPLVITSYDALAAANQNVLSSLSSGVVTKKQSKASTQSGSQSDWKVVITVGGQEITVFGSRHLSTMNAINSIYDTLKVGDTISISNMETSVSNNNIQLALTEQSNITIGYSLTSFCEEFLGNIICNANGTTAPGFATGYSWAQFATLYGKLSSADQEALTNASTTGSELINQVAARYDYIVGKYGTSSYSDFMNREPASFSNNVVKTFNNNSAIMLIVLLSNFLVISAGALLLVLKKYKKQQFIK